MFKSINGGRLPKRATKYSAGFDVFANEDVVIGAGETKMIGLGIALDRSYMEKGFYVNGAWYPDLIDTHYFALHIRSSLRAKGLTSLGTGIIDMDFTHEIKMVIHNPFREYKSFLDYFTGFCREEVQRILIKKGDKIGQLILCRHEGYLLPSEYTKDEERTGGFGSSGK